MRKKPEPPSVFRALIDGSPRALNAALEAGADPNALTPEGDSPLHLALAIKRDFAILPLFRAGASLEARDAKGWTVLGMACWLGSPVRAQDLLDLGADPNAPQAQGFPIHWAAKNTKGFAPKLLLSLFAAGADPNARADGSSYIGIAAASGYGRGLHHLPVPDGFDPALSERDGSSTLQLVIAAKSEPLAERLLQLGADPLALNPDGATPLSSARALGLSRTAGLMLSLIERRELETSATPAPSSPRLPL